MLKLIREQFSVALRGRNPVLQLACQSTEVEMTKMNERGKRKQREITLNKTRITPEILFYLQSIGSEQLIYKLPKTLLKMSKTPDHLYLTDANVAKEFFAMIKDDLQKVSTNFLAEINPGIGLLTEELLQTSIPKICLYESILTFLAPSSILQSLLSKHPERLEIRNSDILKLWDSIFLDQKDGGERFEKFVKGAKKMNWDEEPYMKIVGSIPNNKLLKHLMMSVIFQNNFVANGRLTLYLALPPSDWAKLTAEKNTEFYKQRTVLFQVLFDYKKLGELPRKAFLPWSKPLKERNKGYVDVLKVLDYQSLDVVKIEPKIDLFNTKLSPDDLPKFYFFIKHHFQRNQIRIIPALEKWIPNCGPKLIAKNLSVYSEFRELNPKELLELYQEFVSWPEFETSQFASFTNSFIINIEEGVSKFDTRFAKNDEF